MRFSQGGGIGLEPVYAADVTYDVGSNQLKNGTTAIDTLTVGGVTIGGGGAITADSLALTGTDGTTNVGAAIKDNANNIQAVDGKVTNIQTDVTSLKTTTGQLQTKVGELTDSDTAARNDIISLQKKTEGISEDGSEITTNSLKLRESGSSEEQEITAAKVKGYDKAVAAVGDTSTGLVKKVGDLETKTTDISYDSTTGTTIGRVDGVTFNAGAVSGVKSINGKIEISADGKTVTFNRGETNGQVEISAAGIKVGTGSTYIKGDAIYTGDANYDNAKAGMKSDGSLKAANGNFTVEGATGNTTVGGDLTVAGAASCAKETAFAGGIKTDKISEKTPNAGVTVDGNLHANKNAFVNGMLTVEGDIEGKGALKGKTLGIGIGNDKFTVNENGAVKAASGKVKIEENGKATFGDDANNTTTIAGKVATFGESGSITDHTTINGGSLDTYNLTVRNNMTVENFKAKNITSEEKITVGDTANEVYLAANGTLSLGTDANQKLGKTQLANINDTIKSGKVIEATSATIGGVGINGGDVTTAAGTITGNTITDGNGFTATGGKITAKEGKIGGVVINTAGAVSGVTSLTVNNDINANTFKVNEGNYLDGNGITATGGHIGGAVIDATTLKIGNTILKANGITTDKLTIGDMVLTGTGLNTGTNDFQVNGVTFNQGKVTAKASEGFAAGNSSFKEGSLIVDDNNKLEATNGLTTQKATVTGTLDVTGKATFGTGSDQTTINGKTVTTDTLRANSLILGTSGDATVEVDKDGSLMAAKGKFKVDKDGALKAADGAFTVEKDGKTTFKKDANNLSSINGGNIWAKATDIADNTSSELLHTYKGLRVSGIQAGKTSAFDFDATTGVSTFTGQDSTTTAINGSAITSTKATNDTGVLDGSNLTLKKGDNQTTMSAGKATFKSDNAGKYGGKETTIDGGVITTDTLNVQRINLGKEMVNSDGTTTNIGSNLSIDEYGNIKAAGGNFTVSGTDKANSGALHNEVGNTSFDTTADGASMKYKDGGVTSEVAVEANKATVAAGEQASFVATTDNGGTATITGGTQTVTTTDKGTVFANSDHKTAFVDNGATTTIINGNEITTGKITTDELVITGKGDAAGPGTGSLAFGGNGTIKSDVKEDGSTNNTQFTTDINGVNTKVTDGTTTTENNVSVAGNSNTVTKDDKHKSEFNQGLTSIGGVVTNGEIKVAQKLDGETGLLTNEVTDANGSSKLEQSSTGLTYTDSAKPDNATRIDSSDVSIGSATDDSKRINLSDLGQIDELDKELTGHDKYKDNPTAVGGINAEAAIRREEVARLDGRINDVNDRVNKVGAMAAAIASLKSIGYDPQAPSEFSIGLGQYKGETGVAMGFFHYPNKNFMINVSLSTAGGETMGGIGATWRFGHKSPQKLLEEQREEQAKKELAAAEKYQAAAKLAKEAQERAEYAAKLARQAQVSADNAKAAADATQAKHFG